MAKLLSQLAVLVCLNMVLLITVFLQRSVLFGQSRVLYQSPANSNILSQSAIRTTKESLYVVYGEGNFSDDNDEQMMNYIRSMMSRPGPGGRHLKSETPTMHYSQVGGSEFVDDLLNQRRNGFFVECGAYTGEQLSDTLFFEAKRNWTGILIEAHPDYHREILRKNRRAMVLRACLSASRRPGLQKFKLVDWGSGVSALNKNWKAMVKRVPETDVQCFSLNSIMAAIGVNHIDFMVLDVEGSELPVLQTIDWTKLSIDVFSIEYSDFDRVKKLNQLRKFFSTTGIYREVGKLPRGSEDHFAQDVLFMRV